MNNNTQFLESELIKEEVDDMEECLDHFEAAESAFPLCGRTLSDNEMSEVLDVLQNKTCFSIEKDMFDANDVEMDFVIRVPLPREDLISAEVEQELFFAWDSPNYMTWDKDGTERWTEYHYNINELRKRNLDVNSIERLKKRFMGLFFSQYETKNAKTDDSSMAGKLMKRFSCEDLTINPETIKRRLNSELDLIRRTGLEKYVEAFAKLLDAAKRKRIPMFIDSLDGEGSLVLYCLGIIGRNPLQYCLGFSSFLSIERFTIPWFGIICRKNDERFIYGKLASYFGEDNVGLIPNGIGVMIGGYRVGPPVPSFIDDYTKERLFIVETSELEQKGIVPISLDDSPLLENLLAAEKQIKQNHPDFSLDSIPDDDPETFKMLSDGDTEGLPLLSDRGMKKNLNFLEPKNLDELDAIMSLYFNGPLDLIPMYLDAKRGMLPEGYQELMAMEPLKRTYGVIVYMEQVIEILKRYAGFSDADARSFRHVLMSGKRESIENKKKEFMVDADMLGRNQQLSKFILKMIECFSTDTGFGFKRKVGYWHAVLAYRNAYIKCHFSSGIQNL